MSRYLVFSDLHLGAGADLGHQPGDRLAEQEQVLEQIVQVAIDRDVDAVLFGGDAFEGPHVPPEQYAILQTQLRRLGCPCVAITGNGRHDAAMREVKAPEVLSDVADVHTAPDVLRLPGDVMLAVMPWVSVSRLVAADAGVTDRDQLNALAADLLLQTARGLAEDCRRVKPEWPRILMTHFAISGDQDGISEFAREPVLPLSDLEQLDFDAVVAGHYHRPQLLSAKPVLYCGSPLPLNFGEGGYDHGCWLLDFEGDDSPEFVPLASRPFVTIDFDTSRNADIPGLSPILTGVPLPPEIKAGAYVKVRVTATEDVARRFSVDEMRSLLEANGAHRVWVDMTVERARRDRGVHLAEGLTPLDQLAAFLDARGVNGDVKPALLARAARHLEGSAT